VANIIQKNDIAAEPGYIIIGNAMAPTFDVKNSIGWQSKHDVE
jgi:hypothetical protein